MVASIQSRACRPRSGLKIFKPKPWARSSPTFGLAWLGLSGPGLVGLRASGQATGITTSTEGTYTRTQRPKHDAADGLAPQHAVLQTRRLVPLLVPVSHPYQQQLQQKTAAASVSWVDKTYMPMHTAEPAGSPIFVLAPSCAFLHDMPGLLRHSLRIYMYVVQRLCPLFAVATFATARTKSPPDSVPIDAPISGCSSAQPTQRRTAGDDFERRACSGVEALSLVIRDLEDERLPWRHAAFHTERGIDDPSNDGVGKQPEVSEGRWLDGVGLNADKRERTDSTGPSDYDGLALSSREWGKGDGARGVGVDFQRRTVTGRNSGAGTEGCCEQEEERLHI
ncbi:hypothetical protein FB451DRAFT_1277209 [Mycena latifolia]|nr:hypothetical protein FB451DRAFT_1277209 [Mycena latifolia]